MWNKPSRDVGNRKRKILQKEAKKRKQRPATLSKYEIVEIIECCNEPCGLQRQFYHIVSYELA